MTWMSKIDMLGVIEHFSLIWNLIVKNELERFKETFLTVN